MYVYVPKGVLYGPGIFLNEQCHWTPLSLSMVQWAVENGFRCNGFGTHETPAYRRSWVDIRATRSVDLVAPDGTRFRMQGEVDPEEWHDMELICLTIRVQNFQAPRYLWEEYRERELKLVPMPKPAA